MAITETALAEALGVGGKAQEVADPVQPGAAETNTDDPTVTDPEAAGTETGAEGTQPAEAPQTEPTTGGVDDDQAGAGADGGKEPLTEQQRKENAARRRQQEQQEAIQNAVNAALEQERGRNNAALESFFKRANLQNNFTGEPITTMEQFLAWEEKLRQEKLNTGLKTGKMTAELLDEAISHHPVVQKAQALIDKSAEDSKTAQQEAMAEKIRTEMAEINKLDPSIKTVADLQNMPNFKQFYELVGKNYSFYDAFRIVNFEQLRNAAADVGRQQAANNARSKDHLQATGNSRGSGAASVPKAEMDMFRLLNPNATEAQIQAYYNKHKK